MTSTRSTTSRSAGIENLEVHINDESLEARRARQVRYNLRFMLSLPVFALVGWGIGNLAGDSGTGLAVATIVPCAIYFAFCLVVLVRDRKEDRRK